MNVQSKVAAALAEGAKTVEQIAAEVGAHPQSVRVALWKMQKEGRAMKSVNAPSRHAYFWQLVAPTQAVQAQEAA